MKRMCYKWTKTSEAFEMDCVTYDKTASQKMQGWTSTTAKYFQ